MNSSYRSLLLFNSHRSLQLLTSFLIFFIHINHSKGRHSCERRNPEKHWIPPYQVRGRFSRARNDKPYKTYVVMYISFILSSFLLLPIAHSAQISLAWDPNSETDLAGYKIYYGVTQGGPYNSPGSPKIIVGNITTYKLTDLTPGQTYYVVATAYDTSNNESGYSNEVSGVPIEQDQFLKIPLKAGPNLISFPTIVGDIPIADILSSISGQYEIVYSYEGCLGNDPWKMYDPEVPSYVNDLNYIDSAMGVWIEAKEDTELTLSLNFPLALSIPLCTGWNLISYPGSQAKALGDALSSISGQYEKVLAYKAADLSDPWKIYDISVPSYVNDLTTLEPGLGYWIYIKQNCTLIVNN